MGNPQQIEPITIYQSSRKSYSTFCACFSEGKEYLPGLFQAISATR